MTKFVAIAALCAENRVIWDGPKIPWHYSEDFKHFKETTSGYPIIMGRTTFESIGKPLPNRRNIVMAREQSYAPEGVEVAHSLEEARELVSDEEKVFIIGGAQIYNLFLPETEELIITEIHKHYTGDVLFPEYKEYFEEVSRDTNTHEDFNIVTYKKK